jgi:hypothetical protein
MKLPNATFDYFEEFCKANIIEDCYVKKANTNATSNFRFEPVARNRTYYYPLVYISDSYNVSMCVEVDMNSFDCSGHCGTIYCVVYSVVHALTQINIMLHSLVFPLVH